MRVRTLIPHVSEGAYLVHFSNEGEPVSIIGFEKDNAEPPYDDLEHPYDMGVDAQGNIVVVSGYTPEAWNFDHTLPHLS